MIRSIIISLSIFFTISVNAQFGFERIDTVNVINSSQQVMPWAGGLDYCQVSNIDLNWDGTKDLFVFDRTCNMVLTFLHSGNPGVAEYTYAPEYQDLFPEMVDWVLLVDYNCDGKEDIFTHSFGSMDVYKNVGDAGSGHQFQLEVDGLKEAHPWYMNDIFLSVSSIDIPSLVDVDGDTDIDVLVFDTQGFAVGYHKNLSIENYGTCDSLDFEMKNLCWGTFSENATNNTINLNSTSGVCGSNISNPEFFEPDGGNRGAVRHAGGTLLALDMDGNGVMDLLIGDISFPNMALLMNGGTAPNQDSPMVSVDYNFPSNTTPVTLDLDPGAYHVDVNNDGVRDIVVSPVIYVGAENKESMWYYENSGLDDVPDFQFVQSNFLQSDMIDQGSRSYPVYFDHNGDGLKDLLVSSHGQYDTVINNNISKIAYYENTGTQANPEFTLMDEDYMGISGLGLGSNLAFYPTFGDIDDDGDEDMILGEYDGYLYLFENTGGAGNPAIFNTYIILDYWDGSAFVPVFEGLESYPQLIDLDRDGDLDLVLGRRTGKLSYYENQGNATNHQFVDVSSNLGGVDVSEWWNIVGHSIPQFIDIDNEYHLICGSLTGYLHYYDNIDGNILGNWNQVDTTLENIYIGTYSAPAIYDITDDNRVEMALGNKRGGLALYKSGPLTDVGVEENAFSQLLVYPNPAKTHVTIDFGPVSYDELQSTEVKVYDIMGRVVMTKRANNSQMQLDLSSFSNGTYILEIGNGSSVVTKKLLLQ